MAFRKLSIAFHKRPSIAQGSEQDDKEADGRAAKRELRESHRKQSAEVKELRTKLSALRSILQQVADGYHDITDDLPCFKYSDMKTMIEGAIDAYNRVKVGIYSTEINNIDEGQDDKKPLVSPISKLLVNSRRLSIAEQTYRKQEESYYNLSAEDLQSEVQELQRDHEHVSMEVKCEQKKLDILEHSYMTSQKACCWCYRYAALKTIIEDATGNTLTDV